VAKTRFFILSCVAVLSVISAVVFATSSKGDVTETWCLDEEAREIYSGAGEGRKVLIVTEAVIVDGEAIDSGDLEVLFGAGLLEAIDGADALSTSLIANVWETGIEPIYGHDAFGQRVEIVGETTNDAGHRCRVLKTPGFTTMFRAFWDS